MLAATSALPRQQLQPPTLSAVALVLVAGAGIPRQGNTVEEAATNLSTGYVTFTLQWPTKAH